MSSVILELKAEAIIAESDGNPLLSELCHKAIQTIEVLMAEVALLQQKAEYLSGLGSGNEWANDV